MLAGDIDVVPTVDAAMLADWKVTTDIGGASFDLVNGMAIQSDGKIVVSGGSSGGRDATVGIRVARYNEDGTLDTSFGSGIVPVAGDISSGGVVLQPDGKVILVAADNLAGMDFADFDFTIVRLNSDGTLDSSFGSGGRQRIDFGSYDTAQGVTVQDDGKIVVVGYSNAFNPDGQFAVARLNTDGSLDQTFDGDGKLTFGFNSFNQGAYGVVVQPDGNIVVGGYTYDDQGRQHPTVARLTSNGEFDTSFGTGGKQIIELPDYGSFVGALALQPNGAIVMVGYYHHDILVIRLNDAGQLDTSFNGSGVQTIDFNNGHDSATGIAILPSGQIVIAGTTNYDSLPSSSNMIVARLNGDGSLDRSFRSGGKEVIGFGGYDFAAGVAIRPDGRVIVAGTADQPNTGYDFALALITSDRNVDGPLTNVFEGFHVAYTVELTKPDGTPIANASAGESFVVHVYAEDSRWTPFDVFAAYLDLLWDSSLAELAGDITYGASYPNGHASNGRLSPGIIDEAGGFSGFGRLGSGRHEVFSVPMRALAAGDLAFTTNQADIADLHNTVVYGDVNDDPTINPAQVYYGAAYVRISAPSDDVPPDESPVSDRPQLGPPSDSPGPIETPPSTAVPPAVVAPIDEIPTAGPPLPTSPSVPPDADERDVAALEAPAIDQFATIRLEIVDAAGQPVLSVHVGDTFVLRAFLELTRYQPFAATIDVRFDPERVSPIIDDSSDVQFRWGTIEANQLDETGRIMLDWADNPSGSIFSKSFTAKSEGLALFESDPADLEWHDITALGLGKAIPHSHLTFGSVSLVIKPK